MEIGIETRRVLAEAGFLACIMNDTARARRILAGIDAVAPGAPDAIVGHGLIALTEGDAGGAVDRLRPLADSGDANATALLAVALKLAGRAQECETLLARTGDPALDRLASTLR